MPLPIQNLRSGTANKRPIASSLANGQIAVNYNETDPGIYLRGDANGLIKVSPTYVGSTAPNASPASGGATGNAKGETWLDTSTTPAVLKVWSGSTWVNCFGYGDIDLPGAYRQTIQALGAGNTINCATGNYFTKTITGATTFAVSNVPASRVFGFILELTITSGTPTWFSGVIWPGGIAPTLDTGKVHLLLFLTDNGGTTWRSAALANFAS